MECFISDFITFTSSKWWQVDDKQMLDAMKIFKWKSFSKIHCSTISNENHPFHFPPLYCKTVKHSANSRYVLIHMHGTSLTFLRIRWAWMQFLYQNSFLLFPQIKARLAQIFAEIKRKLTMTRKESTLKGESIFIIIFH